MKKKKKENCARALRLDNAHTCCCYRRGVLVVRTRISSKKDTEKVFSVTVGRYLLTPSEKRKEVSSFLRRGHASINYYYYYALDVTNPLGTRLKSYTCHTTLPYIYTHDRVACTLCERRVCVHVGRPRRGLLDTTSAQFIKFKRS